MILLVERGQAGLKECRAKECTELKRTTICNDTCSLLSTESQGLQYILAFFLYLGCSACLTFDSLLHEMSGQAASFLSAVPSSEDKGKTYLE